MKALRHATLAGSLALAALSLASAQAASEGESPVSPDLTPLLERWRTDHGPTWQMKIDEGTRTASFLYGGGLRADVEPRGDAEFLDLTRQRFAEAQDLMGIEPETLVADHVLFLPLGLAGTTDKISVQFVQAVNGVPVRRGFASALYHLDGELLALDTTGLPAISDFNTSPTVDPRAALEFALRTFRAETGAEATSFTEPVLLIERETVDKLVRPALAWETRVLLELPGSAPEGTVYRVAARGTPRIVSREDAIHFFDVGGTVRTNATNNLLPDGAGNPPAARIAKYMRITAGAQTTTRDANGNFNFPGLTGPVSVSFRYEGTYNDVNNDQGAEYVLTSSLTGTGNSVLMNPSPTQTVTAESNAFTQVNVMRDWTRAVNPADAMMDFVNTANVMIPSTCNAYYDGVSTNYYASGGGCPNTAYSTVVHHEQGHWQNDRYGSGNGPDGFGEGNADVFAMYINDDPIVGLNFCGTGCNVRSGLNTTQFCGDSNPGCYGEVHVDGEPLMGALWKVRRNLKISDPVNGGDTADLLFSAWMNQYNQGSIHSIIETQWLTLDDNDGNIGNGTPHHDDIDDAFLEQGFPGHQLSFITFANVTSLPDTKDDIGPYGVAADLTPVFGSSVVSANLNFSLNGGSFVTIPMTSVGGGTWTGLIPAFPSPARYEWYIRGQDNLGNLDTFPAGAPGTVESFRVGVVNSFFFDNFDTAGDNGWTHALVQTQDDWQHQAPTGKTGSGWTDPATAFSGTKVWGNDLGPSGFNGAYQPNVINYLRSPTINLSAATGSTLSLQRWLTVEEGIYDQAIIRVNGVDVWTNPLSGHLIDTQWTPFELDISAQADGNPASVVEFRLETDGGLEFGGWNLDDFQILTFASSPTNCQPSYYGTGLGGTNGVPTMDTGKEPAQVSNANFVIKVKNGRAGATAFIGVGQTQLSLPIFGGTLLVVPDSILTVSLDLFGQFTLSAPNPGAVGQTFHFQTFVVDPLAPSGFAMTRGMSATICN